MQCPRVPPGWRERKEEKMNDTTPKTIENLNQLLADTTVFYQKLRHYHWNVSGPRFYQYHALF
ncbi:MAG TPA: hypothetical protein ENK19_01065, partial [Acidobacteria bacterium]|nr:hypothetical protein [Acidobacteriota bacterium]